MITNKKTHSSLFFIAGRGRSGTTLLSTILDSHKRVVVSPESGFILSTAKAYHKKKMTLTKRKSFLKDIKWDKRIFNHENTWGMNAELLKHDIIHKGEGKNYEDLCKQVIRHSSTIRKTPGTKQEVIGNKFPAYTLFLPQLARLFPNSRFIILTRDYRDNVLSYRNVPYEPSKSVTFYAWRWRWYNQAILNFIKKNSGKTLLVRYEDLVSSPQRTIKRICIFLEIHFDNAMLNFYTHNEKYEQHRGRIEALKGLRPINKKSLGRHEKELTKPEQEITNYICNNVARHIGYDLPYHASSRVGITRYIDIFINKVWAAAYTLLEITAMLLPAPLKFIIPKVNNIVLCLRGEKGRF